MTAYEIGRLADLRSIAAKGSLAPLEQAEMEALIDRERVDALTPPAVVP